MSRIRNFLASVGVIGLPDNSDFVLLMGGSRAIASSFDQMSLVSNGAELKTSSNISTAILNCFSKVHSS